VLSGVTCWDYKTTSGSANPAVLGPRFDQLGWAFQAAFQERIICTLKPDLLGRIRFRFFVQENEPPYLASVCEPSGAAMTLAHKMVAAAIAIWNQCLSTGQWSGYPTRSVPINLPAFAEDSWLRRELDDEMVQLAADDPFLSGIYREDTIASRPPGAAHLHGELGKALTEVTRRAFAPSTSPEKRRPGRPRKSPETPAEPDPKPPEESAGE
jgi:hypothetical protein